MMNSVIDRSLSYLQISSLITPLFIADPQICAAFLFCIDQYISDIVGDKIGNEI